MKLLVSLLSLATASVDGFSLTEHHTRRYGLWSSHLFQSSEAALDAFADSLDDDLTEKKKSGGGTTMYYDDKMKTTDASWQAKVERLLDPFTPLAQRQILVSELLDGSKQEDIRESIRKALRERKIDPLLTPTGKKLRDGSRAVAFQITNDILPEILEQATSSAQQQQQQFMTPPSPPNVTQLFNDLSNQAQKTLEQIQSDPASVPDMIAKQTNDFLEETKNIFREVPEGLEGPAYTVVESRDTYEIRDYEGYTVASTAWAQNDLQASGNAFNTLASYLFGANSESKSMDMTTPVTTTSLGEMRFFLKKDAQMTDFPLPTSKDVALVEIPPARLAVRSFPGFATPGEISRQKEILLEELELDGWELGLKHGEPIPEIVFQYNPPYTLPFLRKNEIAVPIRSDSDDEEIEWGVTADEARNGSDLDDIGPSDVE